MGYPKRFQYLFKETILMNTRKNFTLIELLVV